MKLILRATIALLALVSVGLAVYAYTEHRQVAYLTLRADHLERRINEIEADAGMVEGEEVAYLILRADHLERRINELEVADGMVEAEGLAQTEEPTPTPEPTAVAEPAGDTNQQLEAAGSQWSEQDAIRVVQREFWSSLNGCGEYPERECYLRDPVLKAIHYDLEQTPNRLIGSYIQRLVERVSANDTQWSAVYEGEQSRWHVEVVATNLTGTLPFYVDERTGIVEGGLSVAKPEPVFYTDQQIFDTKAKGPNRPECAFVKQQKAPTVPLWMLGDLLDIYGCATAEDRLDALEREQKWDQGSRYP
jgi:hypothetical protein